jgi:flagellar FliL protein
MTDKRHRSEDAVEEEGAFTRAPKKARWVTVLLLVAGALLLVATSVSTTLLLARSDGGRETTVTEDGAADTAKAEDTKAAGKKTKKTKAKDKRKDSNDEAAPVAYLALDPPFVVNIGQAETVRFLQVSMEVMTRDPAVLEDVKRHMPAIRNNLVLLLSAQTYETLSAPQGKEQIRTTALGEIQKILKEHTGKPGVEAVYFTGFVMQ